MPFTTCWRLTFLLFGFAEKRLSLIYRSQYTLLRRSVAAMDSSGAADRSLVLFGKSDEHKQISRSLKQNCSIKLPENATVTLLLESETAKPELFTSSCSSVLFTLVNSIGNGLLSTCLSRSKNVWKSPLSCLLFSFTVQMEDGRVVPLLQYVVSIAVTEAMKEVFHQNGLPFLEVKVKWPNDLYLNGLKVGGILCTPAYKSNKFHVSAGFETLEKLCYRTWLHRGEGHSTRKNGDQLVEEVVTIQGLTSSVYLLAIGDDNIMCELHPDGNSLDFFKGLIRRQLE